MTLFVNQTKSYTLTVSSETGEVKILLADDLKERLKEMAADADTNADMVAGLLDAMGDDAAEYLAVAGELAGIGGTLADTLAKGGTDAVIEAIAEMKGDAFEGSEGVRDRAADSSLFSEFADLVAERDQGVEGYGMPDTDGSDADLAAIEAAAGDEGLMLSQLGWVVVGVGVGALVGLGANYVYGEYLKDQNEKANDDIRDQVTFIPADPDAVDPEQAFAEWLERPWSEESLDPTFGQIIIDPEQEDLSGLGKDFDPEAELDGVVMWDKDHIEDAITAAEAQEAADFHYVSTTTPVEAEFQFKPDLGDNPDFGTGDDYSGPSHGDAMATATEYIVKVQGDDDLSLQDTMIFNASLQSGGVDAEGTSGALLEGQISQDEANGFFVPEIM